VTDQGDAAIVPALNVRHEQMMAALHAAQQAVAMPLSNDERAAGWSESELEPVREWLDRCITDLREFPHPTSAHFMSWGRAWDGVPGKAFDPRSSDPLKEVILTASNAVSAVLDFEQLYREIRSLERDLNASSGSDLTRDWDQTAVLVITHVLSQVGDAFDEGRPLQDIDMQRWRDSLVPFGAQWHEGFRMPGTVPETAPRFWTDQPGPLWKRLGRIDQQFERVIWQDA
jgi:hypothetical protein